MTTKRFAWSIIGILLLALLGACNGPAAERVETVQPEEVEAVETTVEEAEAVEVQTEAEATETEAETAAPAAQAGLRSDIRIVVVSHGQASDPFWSVVKNGVDQAAVDMGVVVEYQAPQTFDMVAMSQLIDAAV
ncbi:MAG TPA: hypothetical protein VGD99_19960, partial [Anaerolineae bacterium]